MYEKIWRCRVWMCYSRAYSFNNGNNRMVRKIKVSKMAMAVRRKTKIIGEVVMRSRGMGIKSTGVVTGGRLYLYFNHPRLIIKAPRPFNPPLGMALPLFSSPYCCLNIWNISLNCPIIAIMLSRFIICVSACYPAINRCMPCQYWSWKIFFALKWGLTDW